MFCVREIVYVSQGEAKGSIGGRVITKRTDFPRVQ